MKQPTISRSVGGKARKGLINLIRHGVHKLPNKAAIAAFYDVQAGRFIFGVCVCVCGRTHARSPGANNNIACLVIMRAGNVIMQAAHINQVHSSCLSVITQSSCA
jgi:hypothetical protein